MKMMSVIVYRKKNNIINICVQPFEKKNWIKTVWVRGEWVRNFRGKIRFHPAEGAGLLPCRSHWSRTLLSPTRWSSVWRGAVWNDGGWGGSARQSRPRPNRPQQTDWRRGWGSQSGSGPFGLSFLGPTCQPGVYQRWQTHVEKRVCHSILLAEATSWATGSRFKQSRKAWRKNEKSKEMEGKSRLLTSQVLAPSLGLNTGTGPAVEAASGVSLVTESLWKTCLTRKSEECGRRSTEKMFEKVFICIYIFFFLRFPSEVECTFDSNDLFGRHLLFVHHHRVKEIRICVGLPI